MKNKEAKQLLSKYKAGTCSEEEIALLESWYLDYRDEAMDLDPEGLAEARKKIWADLPVHQGAGRSVKLWPRIAAAASIIICVGIGLIFYNKQAKLRNDVPGLTAIVPGGNKAVLTLADGSKIDLNDVSKGTLAKRLGITVTKTADGEIVYTVNDTRGNKQTEYHTIATPRGGQYQVSLPDGTKVWLNASSAIKYPTSFTANERKVTLSGEAYFEVTPNRASPFKVVSNNQTITVLGTHFNVSAYKDDGRIVTTLLQGKVRVQLNENNAFAELNPREQSILEGRRFKVEKVANDDAIAWKNNAFVFDNETLGSIMRKISRWYDVDVVCPPEMEKMEFSGTVSSDKNIKQALRIMELTGTVHFKFEGRRITVMP